MKNFQFEQSEFSLIEHTAVPIAVYQLIEKRVVSLVISDGFCNLFGYERNEVYDLMDNNMYRDVHPDDISSIEDQAFRFALEESDYNVIYRSLCHGEYRIIHAVGTHVWKTEQDRIAIINYMDEGAWVPGPENSFLKQGPVPTCFENAAFRKNYYDYLTGLPNMSYFFELASIGRQSLKTAGSNVVFLFFNLSGMKFFNQKYGFEQGDALLREVGKLLINHFTNENCARFGNDMFAAYTTEDHIEETLREIIQECETLNNGRTLPIRIGIYPDRFETVDVATACDRAKDACDLDRNNVNSQFRYFDADLRKKAENRQYFISNLDRAIKEHWIQVYYQPIVRSTTGRVSDEEALSRWIDPERGMLTPADFIPVLEDAHLIYKLDLFVLDEILAKKKKQAGKGLYVVPESLNLSRADFESCDIVEEIRKRVDDAGIPREKLTIEITESMIGQDLEFMKLQVDRFHELGFKVWMDDFGSGYSSLDVLQNIHFDLIKFDMRFMQRFFETEDSRIILKQLVRMAIDLGMETLAEGVECREQAEFLREIGCTKLQGYYYCRPISSEEVFERYRKGIQIGFENPAETEYQTAVGKVNLFDLSSLAPDDLDVQQYLRAFPMAVVECTDASFQITRCNQSFREFNAVFNKPLPIGAWTAFTDHKDRELRPVLHSLQQCSKNGGILIFDEHIRSIAVHIIIHRIAVNPITGAAALTVGMLLVSKNAENRNNITYSNISRTLAQDYIFLYYVNINTEQFTEYQPDTKTGVLFAERYGNQFFTAVSQDAEAVIPAEDLEAFRSFMSKDHILELLKTNNSFVYHYRLIKDGREIQARMKITRMVDAPDYIVIGVTD